MVHVLWIPSWYTLEEDPIMGIFFKEQAQCLIEAGIKVGIIFPEMRSLKSISLPLIWKNRFQQTVANEDGIPTCRMHGWNPFPKLEQLQWRFWSHSACQLMERYIQEQGMPDIIHAQSTLCGGLSARAISIKYSIPYLITEHRDVFLKQACVIKPKPSPIIQDTLDNASQIIAISHALKNDLAHYTKKPLSNPIVIPCFADTDFFTLPDSLPKPKPFRFLCVAKLVPSKNLELLLHSFHDVNKLFPNTLLEIAGGGPESFKLKKLAEHLGLEKSVQFTGMISRIETRNAYHRAHAFALPTQWETFGVVFIEALASGLPIVTTRCGGPEDIICDRVGKLVEVNDRKAFTAAMINLMKNYERYNRQEIREKAVSQFGKKAICRQLISLYSKLL